jgi:hypothetical protein
MLGSGAAHLVFRLSDHPIRLYDDVGDMGHAVVVAPGRRSISATRHGPSAPSEPGSCRVPRHCSSALPPTSSPAVTRR